MRPYLKKSTGGVAQGIGSEFKLQYHKKKKKYSLSLAQQDTMEVTLQMTF
jgi:hypothetical protein